MSMRLRKRRRLKAEINVVPYIDVMLVLLIIFMAPRAAAAGRGREAARGQRARHGSAHDPIIVGVTKDGATR